jgi:antitoxin MazE
MHTQVSKWGNSLAVRIPKASAEEAGLSEGAPVELTVVDGKIVIAPACREYALEELVAGITPRNRHVESDWGAPVGKEIW